MFSRIHAGILAKCLLFPLALAAGSDALAQSECPPWAKAKLEELQQRGVQAALEAQRTGNMGPYIATLQQNEAEGSKLPPACFPKSAVGPGDVTKLQCRNQWDDYNRCDFNFRKKLAAGFNPAYTCIRPTCSR